MIKIVVDCFGGDKSPDANIDGAVMALEKFSDLSLVLTGDENIINEKLSAQSYDKSRLEVIHAPDVIGCDEKPTDAIRLKKESSMMRGIKILRDDDSVSGIVSTGSTGALVSAALLKVGRLRGVIRPAFCPVLPTMNGSVVGICDTGANLDITPEHLRQYAIMGGLYLESVYGIKNPRVAMLNVGVEEEKGDELRKNAYSLLKNDPDINFVGNMESRDLLSGKYDLIVCDGFSGNVLVKTTEGTSLELLKKIKHDIYSKTLYKLGAALMSKMFKEEKEFMNYQNYGGSPLVGTLKTVIKGHGSSNGVAVAKCIEQAYLMQSFSLGEKIEKILDIKENENV
ncbi:MAG: phosphate acyltransferase PlsX [Clostridiales bacterium]|nr:phosphate acyltransferase PlsX [Clostridiales bacterium]